MATKRATKKPTTATKKPTTATKKPTTATKKPATATKKRAAKTKPKPEKAATKTKRLRYGLIQEDGSWCFEPTLEGIGHYGEGLVSFSEDERWGFVDEQGAVVIEPIYDRVFNFSGGAASARRDGRWTNIGRDGRKVDGWRGAVCQGRVRVCRGGTSSDFEWEPRQGLFGFLDEQGIEVITPRYEAAQDFREGLAVVQLEATGSGFRFAYIDRDGAEVIPSLDAWDVRSFSTEGWARVQRLDGTWCFIDRQGKVALETPYHDVSPFEDDRAVVREVQDGPCGYIDRAGRLVAKLIYEQAADFSNGLAAVHVETDEETLWGFIDLEGELVIKPTFRDVRPFAARVAPAATRSAKSWSTTVWGLVDRSGSWVVEPTCTQIFPFENGVARFRRDGTWGLFDEQGAVIADGFAAIEEGSPLAVNRGGKPGKTHGVAGGKWGFVDTTGKEIVPPTLDAVASGFRQGRAGVGRKVAV
jgi:hypothetical protein